MNRTLNKRIAIGVTISSALLVASLVFASFYGGALLMVGITVVTAGLLFGFGVAENGGQRLRILLVLAGFLILPTVLLSNYSLMRDRTRWFFLSAYYKTVVLRQPAERDLKHILWDFWGFAGIGDTEAYLVFDVSDSLRGAPKLSPPVRAINLPCDVYRVRRLERQWYVVLFYSDTFWGYDNCK